MMILTKVPKMVLRMVLMMVLRMVLRMVLKMVLRMVLMPIPNNALRMCLTIQYCSSKDSSQYDSHDSF